MKKYAHVLQLLLRLRQCCTHAQLLPKDLLEKLLTNSSSDEAAVENISLKNSVNDSSEPSECALCLETAVNHHLTNCNHVFW